MQLDVQQRIGNAEPLCADRIGFARLTTMAFRGTDLRPLRDELISKVAGGTAGAGEGLDLSLITQLLGDRQTGIAIQAEVLAFHQLFRSPCSAEKPKLRVLALAAAIDMGGNTPIEFLLEESGIELKTLYVIPGIELPVPLPDHDVAIVVASDSEECRDTLGIIDSIAARWPRPMLNPPRLVCNLDRDKLHRLLRGIDGLDIPPTGCVTRGQLSELAQSSLIFADVAAELPFPIIVRPRGSHAGVGLAKVDDRAAIGRYLAERAEQEFFVSRFVDYANHDGLFRKYRIVVIDGRPYACHMAIADRWDIWYLNADMAFSESKRREEEEFMRSFDSGFAIRHRNALDAMIDRIGLDYFTIDCAENKRGELLIFEADNTAVVHNMDSPEVFPYKPPQMRAIFQAFAAMLYRRARDGREHAA
ncbi:MAG TPA: hypothetical protein VNN81_16840 [Bradyrhizobium sp.]|jgi:hypothetical protein|nr:hypothetical protein [Bradyrhizobium sp.]